MRRRAEDDPVGPLGTGNQQQTGRPALQVLGAGGAESQRLGERNAGVPDDPRDRRLPAARARLEKRVARRTGEDPSRFRPTANPGGNPRPQRSRGALLQIPATEMQPGGAWARQALPLFADYQNTP